MPEAPFVRRSRTDDDEIEIKVRGTAAKGVVAPRHLDRIRAFITVNAAPGWDGEMVNAEVPA